MLLACIGVTGSSHSVLVGQRNAPARDDVRQGLLQQGTCISRYLIQVLMQDRIGGAAAFELCAVSLEIDQAYQQVGDVTRTFAVQRYRSHRDFGEHAVGETARRGPIDLRQ